MQFTEVKDWTGKYEAISIVIIFWLSVGAEKKIAHRPWRIRCNDVSQEQVCCGGKPLAAVDSNLEYLAVPGILFTVRCTTVAARPSEALVNVRMKEIFKMFFAVICFILYVSIY